jgi:hypothetical protein
MREMRIRTKLCHGYLKKGSHWENLDIDKGMILKQKFKKYGEKVRTGFIWLRI